MTGITTWPDDVRETVARAICRANCPKAMPSDHVECQVENGWDLWLDEADAALNSSPLGKCLEALKPSGDTKAAYHGEFKFDVPLDGYDEDGEPLEGSKSVYVPWDIVKQIMAAIRERAGLTQIRKVQSND